MVEFDLPPAEVDLTQLFRLQNRHAIICIADHFFFLPSIIFLSRYQVTSLRRSFYAPRQPIGSTTAQGFLEGK